MTSEGPSRCEFAKFVSDHVLRYINRDMLAAIVNCEGMTNEIGENGGRTAPGLQNLLVTGLVHLLNAGQEFGFYIRAFLKTSAHDPYLLSRLLAVTTSDDHLIGLLVMLSGLVTKSGFAPRGNRTGSTDGRFTFTTAVRVVVRVHDRTTDSRADAHVTGAASLTDLDVRVVRVTDLADGGHADLGDVAKLAGGHTEKGVAVLTSHELCCVAGGTGELSAAARVQFDVVDEGTDGDVDQGKGVAGLDVSVGAVLDGVTDFQTDGGEDVSLLAVLVLDESDVRGAVAGQSNLSRLKSMILYFLRFPPPLWRTVILP